MSRTLGVVVVVCTLTAGARGSAMQFAVGGVPIGPGEIVEVHPSDQLTVGIYVEPDPGYPIEAWCVDFFASGPWVPLPQPPEPQWPDLIASGDIRMLPPWDNEFAEATWDSLYDIWYIGGIWLLGYWDGPGVVAEFDVHVPDVAVSTLLGLELSFTELTGPGLPGVPVDQTYPLVLHVTPEPATLGLLALGALGAFNRRRQFGL